MKRHEFYDSTKCFMFLCNPILNEKKKDARRISRHIETCPAYLPSLQSLHIVNTVATFTFPKPHFRELFHPLAIRSAVIDDRLARIFHFLQVKIILFRIRVS
jgi:hypothetical protein